MTSPRRIFIIAGEPSGDLLGAELMAHLKVLEPGITFTGVGGPMMQSQGLQSIFPMSDLGVIGVVEILPRIRTLLRRIKETAETVVAQSPDALITIDAPGFCLRVASKVKAARVGFPIIHYVAPSVWAWRANRARLMSAYVDHVLALLPFEPPYMTAAGMGCDFVGHPVSAIPVPDENAKAAFRAELGVTGRLVSILPGSRRGEVNRLLPVFAETATLLFAEEPDLEFVVPMATPVAQEVSLAVRDWPVPVHLLDPRDMTPETAEARKLLCFASSDAALAASGTVSLELAAMGCPMVIGYRMNHLTSLIVRRLLKVRSATLVNILTDTMTVPEFLQEYCKAESLREALRPLLTETPERHAQLDVADRALKQLGREGPPPGLRAARVVLDVLGAREAATLPNL